MSGSPDDGGEHSPGGIVAGEPGLAHSGPIVHHKSSYVVVRHFPAVVIFHFLNWPLLIVHWLSHWTRADTQLKWSRSISKGILQPFRRQRKPQDVSALNFVFCQYIQFISIFRNKKGRKKTPIESGAYCTSIVVSIFLALKGSFSYSAIQCAREAWQQRCYYLIWSCFIFRFSQRFSKRTCKTCKVFFFFFLWIKHSHLKHHMWHDKKFSLKFQNR